MYVLKVKKPKWTKNQSTMTEIVFKPIKYYIYLIDWLIPTILLSKEPNANPIV